MSNTLVWANPLGTSPANWQAAFGTEINSLASASYALSSVIISNTTDLFTDGWISVALGSVAPSAALAALTFFMQPLNQDGSTYGDGIQSGTVLPLLGGIGSMLWPTSSTAAAQTGFLKIGIEIPPTSFKLGVVNNLGSALAASGNTISIALNNYNLNG
jgi:hypothetical protein